MTRRATICIAVAVLWGACAPDTSAPDDPTYRTTLHDLALEDARRCDSGFEYPRSLVDGISTQLVEELICMDDSWLVFYTSCRDVGCVYADGPQPLAMRPEALAGLQDAAVTAADFISITAGYRDIAMQYYSRWYNENCDASFDAAVPGTSNHQGGRAVDVRYWDFWWDILLDHGFEHPIPTDNPHFEFVGDATFRAESEALKQLSIVAFQRLWNRNNPDRPLPEDGIYGPLTKRSLGESPVEGFPIGACEPDTGGDVGAADAGPDTASDAGTDADAAPDTAGDTTGVGDAGADVSDTSFDGAADATGAPDITDTGPAPGGDTEPDTRSPDARGDAADSGATDASDAPGAPGRDPANDAPTVSRQVPQYALSGSAPGAAARGCGVGSARAGRPGALFPLLILFVTLWRRRVR